MATSRIHHIYQPICIHTMARWPISTALGDCINYAEWGDRYSDSSYALGNMLCIIIFWNQNNANHMLTHLPRQNGCHFTDDIFKCIFLNENIRISFEIPLKFVPKGPINNILALVQIMAWCRLGDKPLSEPMMVKLLTHICVYRAQWVKTHTVPWLYTKAFRINSLLY